MDAKVKERYEKESGKLNELLAKKKELDEKIKIQQSKVDELKETLELDEMKDFGTSLKELGISLADLKNLLSKGDSDMAQLIKAELGKETDNN